MNAPELEYQLREAIAHSERLVTALQASKRATDDAVVRDALRIIAIDVESGTKKLRNMCKWHGWQP